MTACSQTDVYYTQHIIDTEIRRRGKYCVNRLRKRMLLSSDYLKFNQIIQMV